MSIAIRFALSLLPAVLFACSPSSEKSTLDIGEASIQKDSSAFQTPEEVFNRGEPWTGDLDGMRERRRLRALVPYNRLSYFIDGAERWGIMFEALQLFEQYLNRELPGNIPRIKIVFVPVPRKKLLPLLKAGHGDLVAAGLTVRPQWQSSVEFSYPLMTGVREIPVGGPGALPLEELKDLAGRQVHVRASSPYYTNLRSFSDSLVQLGLPPVDIVTTDEQLKEDDILEMVNAGLYDYTMINDYQSDLWRQAMDSIRIYEELPLTAGKEIAWAFRQNSPQLKEKVNEFVKENKAGTLTGNVLINRYLEDTQYIENALSPEERKKFQGLRDTFRKYGEAYGINWLLLIAQGYQESRLDQSTISAEGAVGIMQIKPSTAAGPNVGISNVYKRERNIHAGAKYLRFIADHYHHNEQVDSLNLILLALASYNAGPTRIVRLQRVAENLGLNPNVWFGSVELVAAREIGRQPVDYVSNIYKYFLSYQALQEYQEVTGEGPVLLKKRKN